MPDELKPLWLQCSRVGRESHPFIKREDQAQCEICALHQRLENTLGVMQECLDTLVDGKTVLAAKGLEQWLATMSVHYVPQRREPDGQ